MRKVMSREEFPAWTGAAVKSVLERKKNPELMAAEKKKWKKLMQTGKENRRRKEGR